MRNRPTSQTPLLPCIFCLLAWLLPVTDAAARVLQDQWYMGFGGTGAWLQPNPEEPGNNVEEAVGSGGTLMFGRDLDERSSIQLQGFALGETNLTDGNTASYTAADVSVLYRFYDTRDRKLVRTGFGTAVYGRFALGYLLRDSDTELERGDQVYFGMGAGAEVFVSNNLAIRAEAFYHDTDAVSGALSVILRFGGSGNRAGRLPSTVSGSSRLPRTGTAPRTAPSTPPSVAAPSATTVPQAAPKTAPKTALAPTTPSTSSAVTNAGNDSDGDGDGVEDSRDACANSTTGYPVRPDGCALFDGVLTGIRFVSGSAELAPGSDVQLNFLVDLLLNKYPTARIELHSHTDNTGDLRQQSILTRARLRTVGAYLVDRGLRSNRVVLRSFGGARPLYDNNTQQGRDANNRIEVLERPR